MVVRHVTQQLLTVREELLRVVSEEETVVITEEGVPVVAQVELAVLLSRVPLVDADQPVVARVLREEAGCNG